MLDQWLIDTTLHIYPYVEEKIGEQWVRELPFQVSWREMEELLRYCHREVEEDRMPHADACVVMLCVIDAFTRRGFTNPTTPTTPTTPTPVTKGHPTNDS